MPIRRSPNGARHTPPQAGRDRPEQVVAINRNAWPQSIGISGRNHPVRAPPPLSPICVNFSGTDPTGQGNESRLTKLAPNTILQLSFYGDGLGTRAALRA